MSIFANKTLLITRDTGCYSQTDLFMPQYEGIKKKGLERYHSNFRVEGLRSYDYKLNSGRIK